MKNTFIAEKLADFNKGYMQCLNDMMEFINQVSSFGEPPTIDEIKNYFIKLKTEECEFNKQSIITNN